MLLKDLTSDFYLCKMSNEWFYEQNYYWKTKQHELPRDKTNNVVVRPAKTKISLGIRTV